MEFTSSIPLNEIKTKLGHINPQKMWEELSSYEMVDWFSFFDSYNISAFNEKVKKIDLNSIDLIVSIGVGGSFQGLEAITGFLDKKERWIFLGPSFDVEEIMTIKECIKNKRVLFNIISKTGTTFENLFFMDLFKTEIQNAQIINVVSSNLNFYNTLASELGTHKTHFFEIAEKTGGRFSLMGEMGLLTLFLCGVDFGEISVVINNEKKRFFNDFTNHPAFYRGGIRFLAQTEYNCVIEFLATAKRAFIAPIKWVRQLMAESDGKEKKGLYVGVNFYPEDAHCVGQILREGKRIIAETFYEVEFSTKDIPLTINAYCKSNIGSISKAQKAFVKSIKEDRVESGVITSNYTLKDESIEELFTLFFCEMLAISLEGYLLKINPFNQPGVEGYKNKMKKNFFN